MFLIAIAKLSTLYVVWQHRLNKIKKWSFVFVGEYIQHMFMFHVSVSVSYEKISLREIKMELIVTRKIKNKHFVSTNIHVTRKHLVLKFWLLLLGTLIFYWATLFYEILYEISVDFLVLMGLKCGNFNPYTFSII